MSAENSYGERRQPRYELHLPLLLTATPALVSELQRVPIPRCSVQEGRCPRAPSNVPSQPRDHQQQLHRAQTEKRTPQNTAVSSPTILSLSSGAPLARYLYSAMLSDSLARWSRGRLWAA